MPDQVFRNPPWKAGPEIFMAHEIQDKVDWGQKAIGLEEIFETSKGAGIRVAVLDTGRPTHRDVKDAISRSKNFTNSPTDTDQQGHSTHVCCTLGARLNGLGVVGGAPECEVVPVKVLNDNGEGIGKWVAGGIDYAVENGCDIISMSLGGAPDSNITKAVVRAVNAGCLIVCAAGNEGRDSSGRSRVGSPGSMHEVVAVAAYGENGLIAPFSSQGPEVDIAFPGVSILSGWLNDTYRKLDGTSMATPLCSAVVACRLSYQRAQERANKPIDMPIKNNVDLLALLKAYSIDKGPSGLDEAWGWGILDARKFVKAPGGVVPVPIPVPDPQPHPQPTPTPGPVEYTITLFGKKVRIIDRASYAGQIGAFIQSTE